MATENGSRRVGHPLERMRPNAVSRSRNRRAVLCDLSLLSTGSVPGCI